MKRLKEIEDKWKNHLMVLSAFRYCLSADTYFVSECAQWLCEHWNELEQITKGKIMEEILDALEKGLAKNPCDKEIWQALLDHANENPLT